MPRYIKFILWGCFSFFLLLVFSVLFVSVFNWNHAKPWINRQATELANRPVAIEGDLSVRWFASY